MGRQWHYAQNGQQAGPVSTDQLRQLAAMGQLRREDLVWHEGMPEWASAGNVPELTFAAQPSGAQPVQAIPAPAHAGEEASRRLSYEAPGLGPLALTPKGMDMLRQTKPWVRFFSVLFFIGMGILVVGGVVIAMGGMAIGGAQGAGMGAVLGLIYIALAALYFFPALFLSRFA